MKQELDPIPFTRLARYLSNLPYKDETSSEHKFPFADSKERVDWLRDLLDIDTSANNSKRHKRRALTKAGVKNMGGGGKPNQNRVLDALDAIYKLHGKPAGWDQDISFWRFAYEQLSERVVVERMVGRIEMLRLLEQLMVGAGGRTPQEIIQEQLGRDEKALAETAGVVGDDPSKMFDYYRTMTEHGY